MSQTASAPARSSSGVKAFFALIPGLLLLFVVGYGGKFIEHTINA
jgi:hypothetical protein